MLHRQIGNTGEHISAPGLGCMGMVGWCGERDDAEAPATLRRAHTLHPVAALQSELSPWTRSATRLSPDVCRAPGIGFVAYSPAGRGFLNSMLGSLNV